MTPESNSYTILIRDGLLARVRSLPQFTTIARFGRSRARTIQPEHIPYLGIYLIEEQLGQDGVANSGIPHFLHTVRLGFSYIIFNNDPDESEDFLDQGHWALMNGIMQRPRWQIFDNDVRIEAITKGSRKHVYGNSGLNNEKPTAEMQMELTICYRSFFEPIIPDSFDVWHVEGLRAGEDPEQVQRIKAEWDLSGFSGRNSPPPAEVTTPDFPPFEEDRKP
jgi:hypothetical protein